MNGTKADVGVRRRKNTQRERQAGTGQQGVNLALGQGKGVGGVAWLCVRKCFPPPSPGRALTPRWLCFGEAGDQTAAEGGKKSADFGVTIH